MTGFDFDAIRIEHPLLPLVQKDVKLKRQGKNHIGCCPFHADRTPSFVVYSDSKFHCFGCGADGDVIDYVSKVERVEIGEAVRRLTGGSDVVLSDADRAARKAQLQRDAKLADAKRQNAVLEARRRWADAIPIDGTGHPYLERKNIAAYGTRKEGESLLVPLFDAQGLVQSVQAIPPQEGGNKLYHPGAPAALGRFELAGEPSRTFICEGFATAATVHAATGNRVVVAFSKRYVGDIAAEYAIQGVVVIAADMDGEAQAREIAERIGCTVVLPELMGAEGSDFNDQAAHYGLDDVAGLLSVREAGPTLPGGADPSDWTGKTAPHRQFIIPGWIVRGAAGLLTGQEGVGKSLIAQQMATCAALGRSFVGLEIAHINAMYVTCEDPLDELWRRQESINAALGCTMADLGGRLKLHSLVGELGNELGTFDSEGRITPSPRYHQLVETSLQFGAQLTILDNAAHMFAGNENTRHDVAAFLGLIERYSMTINGAAILLAHPNKAYAQGNKAGNEYSGSTGWSAHVRNRLFIDYAPAPESGAMADPDERVLRKSKANYGKRGEEVTFRWHEWAFVTMNDIPNDRVKEIAEVARLGAENDRFLICLDKAMSEKRTVSARSAASNYAPRVFAKMTVAQGMAAQSFEMAMERLLHIEAIVAEDKIFQRDNRTWAVGIARKICTNPRTNPAQSGAQSPHEAASSAPHTGALHHAPYTTYEVPSPLERGTSYDDEGFFIVPEYDPADDWRASGDWEIDHGDD